MSEQHPGGSTPPKEAELSPEQLELTTVVKTDITAIVPGGDDGYDRFARECVSCFGVEIFDRIADAKDRVMVWCFDICY